MMVTKKVSTNLRNGSVEEIEAVLRSNIFPRDATVTLEPASSSLGTTWVTITITWREEIE